MYVYKTKLIIRSGWYSMLAACSRTVYLAPHGHVRLNHAWASYETETIWQRSFLSRMQGVGIVFISIYVSRATRTDHLPCSPTHHWGTAQDLLVQYRQPATISPVYQADHPVGEHHRSVFIDMAIRVQFIIIIVTLFRVSGDNVCSCSNSVTVCTSPLLVASNRFCIMS